MLKQTHERTQMKITYVTSMIRFSASSLSWPTFVKTFSTKGILSHILGPRQDILSLPNLE